MTVRPGAAARRAFLAGAALLAAAATGRGVAAQEVTYDEGFFEVFVQRIPTRITITTLVDARGNVLIPLRPVVELVGIPLRTEAGLWVLEWPPGVWRTELSLDPLELRVGTDTLAPAGGEVVVREGEPHLSARVLGRVLASRVEVDWAGLGVVISGEAEFPATRRLEREARRERERLAAERLRPAERDVAYPPRTGGVAGTWGMSLIGAAGSYRGALRTAVGGSVWGGATEMGGTLAFGEHVGRSFSEGFLRYHRAFPDASRVRQVEVGSILSRGVLARRMVGVNLTNEPFTSPRYFADALIEPVVPAGWEYEIYQGDALVGVSTGEEVRAPLNYGNTPVRVRMVGPAGQERVEELLYVIPPDRIPEGEWRYNLGLGPCQDPGCDSYGYAEVRRGVSNRLTLGGGVDRIDPTEGRPRVRAYGSVGFTPLNGLNLETQLQPGAFFQASADLSTLGDGVYGASYAWTRPVGDAPTLDGWYGQLSANVPVNVLGGRTVTARLHLRGTERTRTDSWQLFAATALRRAYVSAELEAGYQLRKMATARLFAPLDPRLHPRLADLSVSGGVGATSRGPELLELGASFRPVPEGTVTVDLRFRRGSAPLLSLGFVARRPEGYFQARTARGSGAGLFLAADGGVAWDREGGVLPLPFQSLGRSGIQGRVFHDRNGDGVQGPGEAPAAGVDVLVQGERVTTGEEGAFRSWELRPYEVAVVAVDSLSIDPSWVPAPRQLLVRPSPNVFNTVLLPLQPTREVVGQVTLGGPEPRPLGGVRVEVVDGEGMVVASQRTFSDGVFYLQRVAPGRYTIRVARASAEALGATAPSVQVTVSVGTDAPLEVPTLTLVPP